MQSSAARVHARMRRRCALLWRRCAGTSQLEGTGFDVSRSATWLTAERKSLSAEAKSPVGSSEAYSCCEASGYWLGRVFIFHLRICLRRAPGQCAGRDTDET